MHRKEASVQNRQASSQPQSAPKFRIVFLPNEHRTISYRFVALIAKVCTGATEMKPMPIVSNKLESDSSLHDFYNDRMVG
jgi:hypothetical protein